ncbi:NAD(P)H-dependent glycerol-3-phosphate dehydrogenase [Jiella mangrovi]|uniref:Glycerol-3-phosphate dehydrogenase [NAD(P)+] n=1 Tax=Jiella mangrovi TaxID=2821407 RepID=A0ABS4BDJ3_9HYPH|nr:NAD(P)H-dependent glycerol-3-phosphate dehydrogenase [Jiella mangrovi]MBP0614823.1 NAD(P)-dependent glycerol-3-phosphate dehydrogenase [Jiella mangrovi]
MSRIAVVGAGAWGTALAALHARGGQTVHLVGRDASSLAAINEHHENRRYLPGIALPPAIQATDDPELALADAEFVLLVVPSQSLAGVAASLEPHLAPGATLVLCAKGIERQTGRFMSELVAGPLAPHPVAALSGPSFASDVARDLPTAVTVAATDADAADALARQLSSGTFRCYASDDLTGVEAGGALKNVLALAAGIVSGRNLGASAQAALVTRGFVELRRLGEALGGRAETLMGLSGLGDLVLTCSSPQSRNFAYGAALGRGEDLSNLKLAEGVYTAAIALRLAQQSGIEAPIVETVAAVLERELTVDEAVQRLLARPLKREVG